MKRALPVFVFFSVPKIPWSGGYKVFSFRDYSEVLLLSSQTSRQNYFYFLWDRLPVPTTFATTVSISSFHSCYKQINAGTCPHTRQWVTSIIPCPKGFLGEPFSGSIFLLHIQKSLYLVFFKKVSPLSRMMPFSIQVLVTELNFFLLVPLGKEGTRETSLDGVSLSVAKDVFF